MASEYIIISDDEAPANAPSDSDVQSISPPATDRKRSRANDFSDSESRPTKRSRPTNDVTAHQIFSIPDNVSDGGEQMVLGLMNDEVDSEIPIKETLFYLASFTIFDASSRAVARLETLGRPGIRLRAYGACRRYPYGDDGDDEQLDEETAYRPILLGDITSWWIGDGANDDFMYIQTAIAWYILEHPQKAYRAVYASFWAPHRISQLVVQTAMEFIDGSPRDSNLDAFKRSIDAQPIGQDIGIPVTSDDVMKAVPLVCHTINHYGDAFKRTLRRSTLFRDIVDTANGRGNPLRGWSNVPPPPIPEPNVSNEINTSPLIFEISQSYFKGLKQIKVSSNPAASSQPDQEPPNRQQSEVRVIVPHDLRAEFPHPYFEGVMSEDEAGNPVYFKIGDCVAIKPSERVDRDSRDTGNILANDFWFGQIRRLYKKPQYFENIVWAHVRWFCHSSTTDLQEFGAPNELFWTNDCDDIGLPTIKQKIHVDFQNTISAARIGPMSDKFFCRYLWDPRDGSFLDCHQPFYEDADIRIPELPAGLTCNACRSSEYEDRKHNALCFAPDGSRSPALVVIGTKLYHIHDTISFEPLSEDVDDQDGKARQLWIGRIESFRMEQSGNRLSTAKITVLKPIDTILRRPNTALDITPKHPRMVLDERRLYKSKEVLTVPLGNFVRHVNVKFIPNWQPHSDPFDDDFVITHRATVVNPNLRHLEEITAFRTCAKCSSMREDRAEMRKLFTENAGGLKTMDMCCGSGLLTEGIESMGMFKTQWAIDIDTNSARTFRENHPNAKVFNQDLSECTRNALSQEAGLSTDQVCSLDPLVPSPGHMPKKGEVEAVIAGPPCPDFSMQNIYRGEGSGEKLGLILSVLSLIDLYRPKVFMIENVAGLLSYVITNHKTGEEIKSGVVKLILTALVRLGYSVRWGLFNAANFGTPQFRPRIIFYGAREGVRMPNLPLTTHSIPRDARVTYTRPTGKQSMLTSPLAPLPQVSLVASIGDLPPFEWLPGDDLAGVLDDPPDRAQILKVAGESREGDIESGWTQATRYTRDPESLYQARARSQPGGEVRLQTTRTFRTSTRKAQRVIAVRLEANSDHRSTPSWLDSWSLVNPLNAVARDRTLWAPGRYGRLDWQGTFETLTTRIEPSAKQGRVLHPSQRRVVTVREIARGQGFPDHYKFVGGIGPTIRQIGNAVPFPLARAFAKVFIDAAVQDWYEETMGPEAEQRRVL